MVSFALIVISFVSVSYADMMPDFLTHINPEIKEWTQRATDEIIAEANRVSELAAEESRKLRENLDRGHKLQDVSDAATKSSNMLFKNIQNLEAKLKNAVQSITEESTKDTNQIDEAKTKASKYAADFMNTMSSKFSEIGKQIAEAEEKTVNAVKQLTNMDANSVNDSVHSILERIKKDADALATKGAELKKDHLRLTNPVEDFELPETIRSEL